ncbi:MAG TPA: VOC family protein [Bryobacteraceae bacterium]|jgi:predicted enzyme related to lactoylglutathione lyase|nr:VOC family protein [Bryobacteraceae bacterium]
MPTIDQHAPGSFCLVELATSDQDAAKRFYSQLFSWSVVDYPMGPGGVYTMFQIGGRDAASAYTMQKEMQGIPPHWDLYISVENADAAANRAKDLGGQAMVAPFDVMQYGRMAVLRDPTGAVFCVWQPKQSIGIGVAGAPGTLCWADLNSPDPPRAKQFYESLFGWKVTTGENDSSGYLHIQNGKEFIGGMPPKEHQPPHAPPHWLPYFLVENVDSSVKTAESLGGKTLMPPADIPNTGRFAILADPQDAAFAIFQAAARG